MSNWISVDERLPEPFEIVIVAGGCGYYDGRDWRTKLERTEFGTDRKIQWHVTHWMPLPPPPEPTEDKEK